MGAAGLAVGVRIQSGFLINFLVDMDVRYVVICFGIFEDDDCSRL